MVSMEEAHTENIPQTVTRLLFILLLVVLLVPHTFTLTRYSYIPDEGYTRYTLIAALWSIVYESGDTSSGPYITTNLVFPFDAALLWALIILPLSLYILYTLKRFMRAEVNRRAVLRAILTLLAVQVVLTGLLCYSLDGWLSSCSYPLPLFQLACLLAVYLCQR